MYTGKNEVVICCMNIKTSILLSEPIKSLFAHKCTLIAKMVSKKVITQMKKWAMWLGIVLRRNIASLGDQGAIKNYIAFKDLHSYFCSVLGIGSSRKVSYTKQLKTMDIVNHVLDGDLDISFNRGGVYSKDELQSLLESMYLQPDVPRGGMVYFKSADSNAPMIQLDGFQRTEAILAHALCAMPVKLKDADFPNIPDNLIDAAREMDQNNYEVEDEDEDDSEEPLESAVNPKALYFNNVDEINGGSNYWDLFGLGGYHAKTFGKRKRNSNLPEMPPATKKAQALFVGQRESGFLKLKPQDDDIAWMEPKHAKLFINLEFNILILEETPGGWTFESACAWVVQEMNERRSLNPFELSILFNTPACLRLREMTSHMSNFEKLYGIPHHRCNHFGLLSRSYALLQGCEYMPRVTVDKYTDIILNETRKMTVDDGVMDSLEQAINELNNATKKAELSDDQAMIVIYILSNHNEDGDLDIADLIKYVKAGPATLVNKFSFDKKVVDRWTPAKKSDNVVTMCHAFAILLDLEEAEPDEQAEPVDPEDDHDYPQTNLGEIADDEIF